MKCGQGAKGEGQRARKQGAGSAELRAKSKGQRAKGKEAGSGEQGARGQKSEIRKAESRNPDFCFLLSQFSRSILASELASIRASYRAKGKGLRAEGSELRIAKFGLRI
jgi:hypothetical protein